MSTKQIGFQGRIMLFSLLILTVIVSGCVSKAPETSEGSAQTQETATIDNGDFTVVYAPTTNPDYAGYELLFRSGQTFELLTHELNDIFILPKDIPIVLIECGTPNAFYDPNSGQIKMCYELLDHLSETFDLEELSEDEYEKAIIDTWIFIFYHEMGHAIIDVLDLPIPGREEDAVDQLATVIFVEGDYAEAALNGAVFFHLSAQNTVLEDLAFWDEHALDYQRFYNIICWVYGSNPEGHSYLVEDGTLPESRAERCPIEYQQTSTSWDRLTEPYVK